ncbi:MAG: diguanylate cyclase [Fibromonadaceae bacterium]|jgi:diguanylate cyclase (GGDEF)-like protein|nr:diguanylate cyclase [Fibromonadaceae bacterium]
MVVRNKKEHSVLIVDDEGSNIMALTHILGSEYVIYAASNGTQAIKAVGKHLPDVILLDIIMPDMDGYDVISELKISDVTRNIPVIFITGLSNVGDEEKGLALGAADYIAKPFSPAIVKLRVKNQIKMLEQFRVIERLGLTDQLTGLPNRRSFDNQLNQEWGRALREQSYLSILVIDADSFKNYNDSFGHQQGDVALKSIAQAISQTLKRSTDFVARWGGEEFIVLLPSAKSEDAFNIAERIRQSVEDMVIPCPEGMGASKITISLGLNSPECIRDTTIHKFIAGADAALYEAKAQGRNRVCIHSPSNEEKN